MTPPPKSSRRKNAREEFRLKTDAEALAVELERAMRAIQDAVSRLPLAHLAEIEARPLRADEQRFMAEALHALNRVKGQMFLERVMRGLPVYRLTAGTGWSRATIQQFENRESDAYVSSLFRYAAGLRAAGVRGHIEIRWVPDHNEKGEVADEDLAA